MQTIKSFKPSFLALVIASSLTVTACGGGGGGSSAPAVAESTGPSQSSNSKPVAVIDHAATAQLGNLVSLSGQNSNDPDKDPLTYQWTLIAPEGSDASLLNPLSSQASFTPDVPGTYAVSLVVSDGALQSETVTSSITVTDSDSGSNGGDDSSDSGSDEGSSGDNSGNGGSGNDSSGSGDGSSEADGSGNNGSGNDGADNVGEAEGVNPNADADLQALLNLKPGEWYEIKQSNLSAVTPQPEPEGNTGIKGIMRSWNGGAYDSNNGQLLVWGGGHQDYAGNEVYGFDVHDLIWRRLNNPATNLGVGGQPYYADGTPTQRHTYDSLEFLPSHNAMCAFGGAGLYPDVTVTKNTDCFDVTKKKWFTLPSVPTAGWGSMTAVDSSTGKIWQHGAGNSGNLAVFDPVSKKWQTHGTNTTDGWVPYPMSAAIHPAEKKFVAVGGGKVQIWDMTKSPSVGKKVVTTGDNGIVNAEHPAVEYDPIGKRIVAWNGGTNVYTLNLKTLVWKKLPVAAGSDTPGSAAKNGTHGRFRFVPELELFIAVNHVDRNVFFVKLANG